MHRSGDGEEGTGAAGGGSKDQGKSGAADAAAVTAAELGEEIAQQIMETVLKARRQVVMGLGTIRWGNGHCPSPFGRWRGQRHAPWAG